MHRPTAAPLAVAIALIALLIALPAAAKRKPPHKPSSAAAKVLRDCVADGDLDVVYRTGVLKLALRQMPKAVRNYTDCEDVVRPAITAGRTPFGKRPRPRLKRPCTRHPPRPHLTPPHPL